eukprot:g19527.t1
MVASGAAALGLCHICLASARPEILERCLFWANGMVGRASTVGWQEVISWIRDRLGDALPPSSLPWREALDETCGGTRACDEPLLREAFAVTLHRRPSEVGAIPLHAGRCSAADSLLCRFRKKLDIELCHHMRYPLGVLLLSQPETSPVPSPSKSCLEQLRDLNRSVRPLLWEDALR